MDIQKENVDFGDYCSIEQKRYGAPNELYGYKVVGRLRSNSWVDTPVDAQDRKPKLHSEIVDVVQVISCTAGCDVVEQFRVSDLTRAWQQAQKVAVPEGFVLVSKSSISEAVEKIEQLFEEDSLLALGELLPIQQGLKTIIEAQEPTND